MNMPKNGKLLKKVFPKVLSIVMALTIVLASLPASADAAAKPKFTETKKTITIGDTATLKISNKVAGSTYAWSTSNKKIATVTNKGVVKAVKKGAAVVSCKVTAGKSTYNLKCNVTVSTEATVSTQAQLNKALKNSKVTKVTIKTTAAKKFTVPKGTYGSKTLVVNAPKADVTNRGVFKAITVQAIKSNTWIERAVGNKIKITASSANFVVGKEGKVANLELAKANATISIKVNGSVEKVEISKVADVKLTANGAVGAVNLDAAATLQIDGTEKKVTLNVSSLAKGADVSTSIPVDAKVAANIDLKLEKGAEGSSIDKTASSVVIKVENQTTQNVDITTGGGNKETVNAGSTTTVGDTSTPPTGDGGSGGGGGGNVTTGGSATVTGSPTSGNTATFSLPVSLSSLTSITVNVLIPGKTGNYNFTGLPLTYLKGLVTKDTDTLNTWKAISSPVTLTHGAGSKEIKISPTNDVMKKTVEFDNATYTVAVVGETVEVQNIQSDIIYTLSRSSDNLKLTIKATGGSVDIANLVTFSVVW